MTDEAAQTPSESISFDGIPAFDASDFVLYFRREGSGRTPDEVKGYESLEAAAERESGSSTSVRGGRVSFLDVKVTMKDSWEGRGLACRCYGGAAWSVAIRGKDGKAPFAPRPNPIPRDQQKAYAFAADGKHWPLSSFLFSVEDLCTSLMDLLLPGNPPEEATGLIVIAGSTGSAKSQIARALLHRYLVGRIDQLKAGPSKSQRPHLVTIERPLESNFLTKPLADKKSMWDPIFHQPYGIDFTPRLLNVDTDCIEDAFTNALRQKPTVLFLDEVRKKEEWEHVFRFAGSGHLIFTTAHAGSLTEAMGWMMGSVGATTPTLRGDIADRIRGLIHVRRDKVASEKALEDVSVREAVERLLLVREQKSAAEAGRPPRENVEVPNPIDVLLPTVWRNTPAGISRLVADGLSSLTPGFSPRESGSDVGDSCLGRRWFACRLKDRALGATAAGDIGKAIVQIDNACKGTVAHETAAVHARRWCNADIYRGLERKGLEADLEGR